MVIGIDRIGDAPRPDEYDEIDALLAESFEQQDESALVRKLRADGDIWHELVTRWEGVIAGYVALSRMKAPKGWACLGPLAVLPRFQNGGAAPKPEMKFAFRIGTPLARLCVEAIGLPDLPTTIVVLGEPRFYERAGFSLTRAQKLDSPYPLSHTLIARRVDDVPMERLTYPAAFSELG